jgi:PAS domain-containing protein
MSGGELAQDFITQEYQVSVMEVLDNALKGRETANFEFPLYTKDRQRVEVLLNATTRRDVSGAVVGMIGVGQDITERKQVEMEKARVAQELQTFIDTANAPIFGIDAHGLVNEWNNKSEAITGFSRSEVLGKNLVQVLIDVLWLCAVCERLCLCGWVVCRFSFRC